MKKLVAIVVTVILALGILLSGDCHAGNEGWAAAGGFLGGLVIGSAINSRPHYYHGYYSSYPVYSYPVYSTYGYRRSYYRPSCYTTYTTYCDPCYYYDYWY